MSNDDHIRADTMEDYEDTAESFLDAIKWQAILSQKNRDAINKFLGKRPGP
jgi:hypothetical protein